MDNLLELTDAELSKFKKEGRLKGPLAYYSPEINPSILNRIGFLFLSNHYNTESGFRRNLYRKARRIKANAVHVVTNTMDLIEGVKLPYTALFYNVSPEPG